MVECYITGALVFLEIQQWDEGMKSSQYHLELCATDACTKRLMEYTKGLGQRALKDSTIYFFLFNSWFSTKKSAKESALVGVDFIGMVKTNTNRF